MKNQQNLQPELRKKANDILQQLSPSDREALLVKNWMSHDARWFMASARELGMPAANRLNRIAAREIGKVEAQRLTRALPLPPAKNVHDYLCTQEIFIGLLGPDLLDYRVNQLDDRTFRIEVERCFAFDNAVRAGIAAEYGCGILARLAGWLDGLGLAHTTNPAVGKCLRARGKACAYAITLSEKSLRG